MEIGERIKNCSRENRKASTATFVDSQVHFVFIPWLRYCFIRHKSSLKEEACNLFRLICVFFSDVVSNGLFSWL